MKIDNIEFKIYIQKKKITNIYLRLLDAQVLYITCPYDTSNEEIIKFINKKKSWILKNSERFVVSKKGFKDPIYYLGKKYNLVIKDGINKISINEDTITIYTKEANIDKAKALFYSQGAKVLNNQLDSFKDKYLNILKDYGYHLDPIIKYRLYKSRWGACIIKKNIIELNELLIHYDTRCLEAVFWHECVHFIIPNHSDRFHNILNYHMPDYIKIHKELI